jgi:hypothetical protein
MKKLILASILCVPLFAQEKLIPPEKLLEFPSPAIPNSGKPAHKLDLSKPLGTVALTLTGKPIPSGICSVPLIEAHAQANDPGIAFKPGSTSVAIPQARVPAPPCEKTDSGPVESPIFKDPSPKQHP